MGNLLHLFHHHKRKKYETEKMKESTKEQYDKELKNQPKKFDYYCPSCLFQTDTYSKICPKCNKGKLQQTTGNVTSK